MRGMRAAVALVALCACGHGSGENDDARPWVDALVILDDAVVDFVPGDPIDLSQGTGGRDEDPFVLRARDNWYYVAWFSERTGNGDIYLRRTRDGHQWSQPIQVTGTPDVDLYPTLYEDDAGTLHLAFFRRAEDLNGKGHIVYTHTADPLIWDVGNEVAVTVPAAAENDWTPAISRTAAGAFVIAFARDHCYPQAQPCFDLQVTTSTTGAAWSSPVQMVDPSGEQDLLPYLMQTDDGITAVWNRYAANATLPYFSTTTDIATATSDDGVTWSAPVKLTDDDPAMVADLFPVLFADPDTSTQLMWLQADASPLVVNSPLDAIAPSSSIALPYDGYSHHIVATPQAQIYLAAWVDGADPEQSVHARVIERAP